LSQQINLFNPDLLKKSKSFSVQILMVIVLVVCALLGLWFWYVAHQLSEVVKESEIMAAKMTAAQAELAKVTSNNAPRQKSKELELMIQTEEAELEKMQKVFQTLEKGDFGNTDGYSDYFRAFARHIQSDIWLTGINIRGANEIGLKGRALKPEAVPAYISRLAKEPALKGKSFSTLEMAATKDSESKEGATATSAASRKEGVGFIEFNLQSSNSKIDKNDTGAK